MGWQATSPFIELVWMYKDLRNILNSNEQVLVEHAILSLQYPLRFTPLYCWQSACDQARMLRVLTAKARYCFEHAISYFLILEK